MNTLKKGIKILREEDFGTFVRKTMAFTQIRSRRLIGIAYVSLATPLVKRQIAEFEGRDPARMFDFISRRFFGFFLPVQIRKEFLSLLKMLSKEKLSAVLEIGTAKGGALFCFSKLSEKGATIISLDLPKGPFGGGYDEYWTPFYEKFGAGRRLSLLRGDSHREEMKNEVGRILEGKKLDLLFIDGDHAYEGVKRDFEMYKGFVRSGGKIVFHDIAPEGDEQFAGGAKFLWEEIKKEFPHHEIIADPEQKGFGIGVIDMP